MASQTPNQAAALHRAEINLTVDLNPDRPISSNQIPSLLSSLALVHAEANLLNQLDRQITTQAPHHLDQQHLRRLNRLIRSIQPCANFLQAVTTSTHLRLSIESARTIAAFIHLHVAHTPDLVTALAAFVSLALEQSSTYTTALLHSAVDIIPALHALLEQPVEPSLFHRAALPALPAILHIATQFVEMIFHKPSYEKMHGMLAIGEIAVDVVANVLRSYPAQLGNLQSHVVLLSRAVDRILSDVPEAQTLQRDVRNLLQIGIKSSPSTNMPSNE